VLTGCGVTVGTGLTGPFAAAHTQLWLQQFGAQPLNSSFQVLGFGPEAIAGVAVDPAGNVVGGGYVAGNLPGNTGNQGEADAYLVKFDPTGKPLWARQYSTGAADFVTSVSTDPQGNILAAGATVPAGQSTPTAVVFKTDGSGNVIWADPLPAPGVPTLGQVVKADAAGNVFVAGFAYSAEAGTQVLFMAKLSGTSGSVLWYSLYPTTPLSLVSRIAVDPAGNALVTGAGVGPGLAFVAKVQGSNGNLAWAEPLGTSGTITAGLAVASDAQGNAIIGGASAATGPPIGFTVSAAEEGFLAKYSAADGTQMWSVPVSTKAGDVVTSVQVASDGTILAAGLTNGLLAYTFTQPTDNIFIAKFAADATHISAQQFGTGPLVGASSYFTPQTALDASGNLFISGATTGAYQGFTNNGGALQMFIAKFGPQ
jgi:outer membrane protein assembly factor BamB